MPISESPNDAPRDLVRVRHLHSYTGHIGSVRGVSFVAGVAQNGIAQAEAERLLGIGIPIVIEGPWEAVAIAAPPPVTPAAVVPVTPVDVLAPTEAPPPKPRDMYRGKGSR